MVANFNSNMSEGDTDLADELYRLLRTNSVIEHRTDPFYSDGAPAWFSKLLATLTILIGDDKIEHSAISADHQTPEIVVTILTEGLLVRASVTIELEQPGGGTGPSKNWAISRSRLQELSVEPTRGVFSDSRFPWPGPVTVFAKYDGVEEVIRFFLDPNRRFDSVNSDVSKLIESLRKDLA